MAMIRFTTVLLDVWREACRHIEIGESVSRIAPMLTQHLPVDLVLVRRLDPQRSAIETVATGVCRTATAPEQTRNECTPEQFTDLLNWCRVGRVLRETAADLRQKHPALLPAGIEGQVLVGSLNREDEPVGVLVLATDRRAGFQSEHEALAVALLEPFGVALENDRQLHELSVLREAVEADNRSLLARLGRQDISDSVVGSETGLRDVMERVNLVALSDVPVLILGETGSGKEVVARAIHKGSRRQAGPFLRVNCGAIPPELIDSELFGHERGSFTGALATRKGWFERADGGTLFLDEVGELPPAAQVRLLRILQDGSFERVGAQRPLHVDVRVVAATNRDLHAMVADGTFREDLWYRIAVFVVRIPPLRERIEDIPTLASHFALRATKRLGTPPLVPTPQDNDLLVSYDWPGNVRELSAVIERAAILGMGRRLDVAAALGVNTRIAPRVANGTRLLPEAQPASNDAILTLDSAMAEHIRSALTRTRGRIEGRHGAARLLGINPYTLRARMRKLGIDWTSFREV
jgi:hydrogenase-4 transcriptional activator